MQRILKWIERNEGLVAILLVLVILRIPSLFEPHWYGDEGIYLTLGMAIRKGLVLYRDIHDNKPPLIYFLAAVSGSIMWFRLILMGWSIVNVGVMWGITRKVFKQQRWAIFSTAVFGLLTTLPILEGNVANGELFMILPVCLAVWLLLNSERDKTAFWAGLLLAIGFLFKVPVAFDAFAVGAWIFGEGLLKRKIDWGRMGLLVVGFFVPVLIVTGYYFLRGAGQQFIVAAFFQNVGYLSSWRTGSMSAGGLMNSGLLMRGVVCVIVSLVAWLLLQKRKPAERLVVLWLVWSGFGVFLSERPYPHYLIQVVPAVSLALGMFLQTKSKVLSMIIVGMGVLLAIEIVNIKFGFYPVVSYYSNFVQMIAGKKSMLEYQYSFDYRVKRDYEVSRYIKMATEAGEKIFVWGDEPFVYALSDRLPVGNYTVAYHIVDFGKQEETMKKLRTERPNYVLVLSEERRELPELMGWLATEYNQIASVEGVWIFRVAK